MRNAQKHMTFFRKSADDLPGQRLSFFEVQVFIYTCMYDMIHIYATCYTLHVIPDGKCSILHQHAVSVLMCIAHCSYSYTIYHKTHTQEMHETNLL